MALAFRVALLLSAALSSACFPPGEGVEPPLDRVYFPVGLALETCEETPSDQACPRHLFVVNSNFDLQFNGGTLQTFSAERIVELVGEVRENGCGSLGTRPPEGQVVVPGLCGAVNPEPLIRPGGAVGIGAFATDVVFRPLTDAGSGGSIGRLYVPVRGDTTLHFIDVDADGALQCGQSGNDGDCDDNHRRGDDPEQENTRGLRLPPEPFGLAVSSESTEVRLVGEGIHAVAVTHQTEGAVSLFVDDSRNADGPLLEFIARGIPNRPTGIAAIPRSQASLANANYPPGFLVTFRDASEVRLLRFFDDILSGPARPYLEPSLRAEIRTNVTGFDSRGIAIDASVRGRAEARCEAIADEELNTACLIEAGRQPLDVFVANRTPASLIVGQTIPDNDLPQFFDTIPLDFGPSRVVVGEITNAAGLREARVFVVCFDARVIYIYHPMRRSVETRIETGRGPHALAIDAQNALAYVGHFTDSYIAVVGLDQGRPDYGKIVLTVGPPTPPRASK